MHFWRKSVLVGVAGAVALAGCGDPAQPGRTGTGAASPNVSAPAGAAGETGPGPTTAVEPGQPATAAPATGGATGIVSPGTAAGGEGGGAPTALLGDGTPAATPNLAGLEILGIPVNALTSGIGAATPSASPTAGPATGGVGAVPGSAATTGSATPTPTPTPTPGVSIGTIAGILGRGVATGSGGATVTPIPIPTPGPVTDPGPASGGTISGGGTNTGASSDGSGTSGTSGQIPLPTTTAFCGPARDLSNALSAVAAANDAGSLQSAVGWARRSFATAQATAPAGLQDAVNTLANAFGPLFDGLQQAGYDRSRVDIASISGLQSTRVNAAGDRLNQYIVTVC